MVYGGIRQGEELRLERNAMVVLAWKEDKRFERLAAREADLAFMVGQNRLEGAMPDQIEFAPNRRTLIVAGVKRLPALTEGGVSVPRGDPEKASRPQVVPIDGSTTSEPQPKFEWPAVKGAAAYQLTCSKQGAPPWKVETKEPRATYNGPKLNPGAEYRWTVTTTIAGREETVVKAHFQTADEDVLASLPDLAKEFTAAEEAKEPAVMALIALEFEHRLLLGLAADAYDRLARLTPKSPAVHAALAELYARAGRVQESQQHRKLAKDLGFVFDEQAAAK